MKRLYKKATLSLLTLSLNFAVPLWAADNYQIVDLGNLGGTQAEAFGINNLGDIVGNAGGVDFDNHAFVYRNQGILDLGFLPVNENTTSTSYAFDINNNGLAVGFSTQTFTDANSLPYNRLMATYYDTVNLTISSIPQVDPLSPLNMRAERSNDNDIIVGVTEYDDPNDVDANGDPIIAITVRGFVYDINSGVLDLLTPPTDSIRTGLALRAINNNGVIVGVAADTVSNGVQNAVLSDIVTTSISDLTQVSKITIYDGVQNQVWSINDNDIMVGSANTATDSNKRAFSYNLNTQEIVSLGSLNTNFPFSEAFKINNLGQIVGVSQYQNSPIIYHAFLYENGTMKDLSKLIGCDTGWVLSEARSINDSGIIVGTGLINGEKHAYMLTPIAGTAPVCDSTTSTTASGGGSMPIFLLVFLSSLMFYRREKKNHL